MLAPSLVLRPFKRRRRKCLVHTAYACTGISIATGYATIAIIRGFCMIYSSMDDKRRVYTIISDYPTFFWDPPAHAHACNVTCSYQALSPPPLEGPGYEAS